MALRFREISVPVGKDTKISVRSHVIGLQRQSLAKKTLCSFNVISVESINAPGN